MVLVSYPNRAPDKLTSEWRGPLAVVRVEGQTYHCQDLVNLTINPYFVDRLKFYHDGGIVNAHDIAMADKDEVRVEALVNHRGDPKKWKTLFFR